MLLSSLSRGDGGINTGCFPSSWSKSSLIILHGRLRRSYHRTQLTLTGLGHSTEIASLLLPLQLFVDFQQYKYLRECSLPGYYMFVAWVLCSLPGYYMFVAWVLRWYLFRLCFTGVYKSKVLGFQETILYHAFSKFTAPKVIFVKKMF